MHPQAHQFPNNLTTFKDTLGKGAISVRGFNLVCDADGFIEGPADLAKDIEPHGFLPMPRPVAKPASFGRK